MPKPLTAEELAAKEKRLKQRADALARKHAYAAKKAAEITAQLRERQRFAEAHIKYALGGCLLNLIEEKRLPENFVRSVLQSAEAGVQPVGSGREAWESLKERWLARYVESPVQ